MKKLAEHDRFEYFQTHLFTRPVFDPRRRVSSYTFQSAEVPEKRSWVLGGGFSQRVHLLTEEGNPKDVVIKAKNIRDLSGLVRIIEEVAHAQIAKAALKARRETVGQAWDMAAGTYREGVAQLARKGIRLPR